MRFESKILHVASRSKGQIPLSLLGRLDVSTFLPAILVDHWCNFARFGGVRVATSALSRGGWWFEPRPSHTEDLTRVGVKATQCSPVYTFIVFKRLV